MVNLPEEHRFERLRVEGKHLIDTIKMIAYRAETATVNILKEDWSLHEADEARSLMREIYRSSIDLIVDEQMQTLEVRLHNLANKSSDDAARKLFEELNASETKYPGTNLRLIYKWVSD